MKTADAVQCVVRPDGSWALIPKYLTGFPTIDSAIRKLKSVFTTDTPRFRQRDTVLTAEITPHDLRMIPHKWFGDLQADIAGLSAPQQKGVLEAVKQKVDAAYSNALTTSEMRRSPDGSLRTAEPAARPEKEFGQTVTIEELQEINDEHYGKQRDEGMTPQELGFVGHSTGDGTRTHDVSNHATPASIDAANKDWWRKRNAPPRQPRGWGQG